MPTLDLVNDWQIMDDVEAVRLYQRLQGDAFGAGYVTVTAALGRETRRDDVLAAGLFGRAALTWFLWTATFSDQGAAPKVRDVIQDGRGGRWSILAATLEDLLGRYECLTVKER